MNIRLNLTIRIIKALIIIGLHYYNITHAKLILTEQRRLADYKLYKQTTKLHLEIHGNINIIGGVVHQLCIV